jgi:hypothetical protein
MFAEFARIDGGFKHIIELKLLFGADYAEFYSGRHGH